MKCEFCLDFEPREGITGWCKAHKCFRQINDSCTAEEQEKRDRWGGNA